MFHRLRVSEVDPLTDEAVAVTFEVPQELRETFRHRPGQHITVRRTAGGQEIRRNYSICTPATDDPVLKVGIQLVEGGEFSTYALKALSVGDAVQVLPPAGRFVLEPRSGEFAAIVGGSGVTPVLSMASTLLAERPDARFCLIRSDRSAASVMFVEEVADLKDLYPGRFQLVQSLSREERQAGLPAGRLTDDRLRALLPALLPVDSVDGWFLCGPLGLVAEGGRALRALGVPRRRIHQEIFHIGTDSGPAGATTEGPIGTAPAATHHTVLVTLDGRRGRWPVQDGETLLTAVLRHRADAPYACRGGVCGTCRARLVSGKIRMDRNFALEPDEIAAGYVLACQAHPVTQEVELDFDG